MLLEEVSAAATKAKNVVERIAVKIIIKCISKARTDCLYWKVLKFRIMNTEIAWAMRKKQQKN